MNSLIETLRNLGTRQLLIIGAVGVGLLVLLLYISSRLSTPTLEMLYSELSTADAAAIAKRLDELKVPFKVDDSGTRIMVPADQVGRLRMQMAQAGLPAGGSIGYEIFDREQGFGTTGFIQNMNQLRAVEGELARTVMTLAPVQQARVHLVLPKRELFSRAENAASASVFIKLRQGAKLEREQILAIQHLLAAAVAKLEPARVAIIDDRGNLLARGTGSQDENYLMATAEEKKVGLERRLTQTIEDLVGRSLGYGKVRAEVTADLDLDRITINQDLFDPENQVVRSNQTVNETQESQERDPLEPVTVNTNLPTQQGADPAQFGPLTSSKNNRTEETTNYEISRTQRTQVKEPGAIKRLSIAVLVDGDYVPGANDGPPEYKPRSEQDLAQIERLVRSAVGVDAERGDTIEVVNMRFATVEGQFDDKGDTIFGIPRDFLENIAAMLVMGIVAILIILVIVRPLVTKAFERPSEAEEELDRLLTDQTGQQAQLAGPAGALAEDLALEAQQADDELEQMIDINRVEGRVRASSLRKVGEIVEKHPEEAVAIIRNWLYQEG